MTNVGRVFQTVTLQLVERQKMQDEEGEFMKLGWKMAVNFVKALWQLTCVLSLGISI